jgi:hypothetical protein
VSTVPRSFSLAPLLDELVLEHDPDQARNDRDAIDYAVYEAQLFDEEFPEVLLVSR